MTYICFLIIGISHLNAETINETDIFTRNYSNKNFYAEYKKFKIEDKFLLQKDISEYFKSQNINIQLDKLKIVESICEEKEYKKLDDFNLCKICSNLELYIFDKDHTDCLSSTSNRYSEDLNSEYKLSKQKSNEFNSTITNELSLTSKNNILMHRIENSDYMTCMKNKGWKDPSKWSEGKIFPILEVIESKLLEIN